MTPIPWRCFGCRARAKFAIRIGTAMREPKRSCGRHLASGVDEVCRDRSSDYVHVEQIQRGAR